MYSVHVCIRLRTHNRYVHGCVYVYVYVHILIAFTYSYIQSVRLYQKKDDREGHGRETGNKVVIGHSIEYFGEQTKIRISVEKGT